MTVALGGRVALVTGASRGLGREIAIALARRGARVAVMARTATSRDPGGSSVEATVRAIEAAGGSAVPVACDVTDDEAVAERVEQIAGELGPVDILVNCAGVVALSDVLDTTMKRLDLLWRVNVRAPAWLTQLVVPGMIERRWGHVVNVGSLSSQWRGTQIPLGYAGYTSTKAALVRMSHAHALDLHPFGVAVNVVAPSGLVPTEGWTSASAGATRELPNQEPPTYVARAVAWVVEQDPASFTGRFVESQALLASLGELDHPPLGWEDLARVDVASAPAGAPDAPGAPGAPDAAHHERAPRAMRPLPALTPSTAPFWTSGEDGRLRVQRCRDCGYSTHPPGPVCGRCGSRAVGFEAVSGRGTVYALTRNHHPWLPGWDLPYVVATVQLEEQEDLRLVTNLVGPGADEARIGDPVRVVFEHRDGVWLPLFERDGVPS